MLLLHCFTCLWVGPILRYICHNNTNFPIWDLFYIIHAHCRSYILYVTIYPMSAAALSKYTYPVTTHWGKFPVLPHLLHLTTSLIGTLVHSNSLNILNLLKVERFSTHFIPSKISASIDVINLFSWLSLGF